MKYLFFIVLFLGGCISSSPPISNSPIPFENYDEAVLKENARALNMRYVDYLHALTNNKIPELRKGASTFYQAHDPNWANDPTINPVFETEAEANEYAKRNNMSEFQGGHSYIVREVNYRYEVRHVNDAVNHSLHNSFLLQDSKDYVDEYKESHMDLFIYDLKTGAIIKDNE